MMRILPIATTPNSWMPNGDSVHFSIRNSENESITEHWLLSNNKNWKWEREKKNVFLFDISAHRQRQYMYFPFTSLFRINFFFSFQILFFLVAHLQLKGISIAGIVFFQKVFPYRKRKNIHFVRKQSFAQTR